MAVNKNAFIRYQALDRCFRNNGRMYFLEDLIEECNKALFEINPNSDGIRKRQISYDIRFMESDQGWSIPLERYRFGKRTFYRYSEPAFSINNQPLNKSEAAQLKLAISIISRFSGTPQFEWINEIIPVIENKLGLVETKKSVISFESNIDLKGTNYLSPAFNAIINERVLEITYQDFKQTKPYTILYHPYYIKQYNNRWFVFGFNEENGNPCWNLAFDRIEKIMETNLAYRTDETDWDEYFYDIIGVTKYVEQQVEDIILQFKTTVAQYIISKPIHPTQKHKLTENGLEVRIKVIPNYELKQLILSFGENVKVIKTENLLQLISAELNAASTQYFI